MPLNAEQQRMVMENTGLIGANVRRKDYANIFRRLGHDAMWDIAEMALIRAAEKFDPQRGVLFCTFAYKYIRTAFLRAYTEHVSNRQVFARKMKKMEGFEFFPEYRPCQHTVDNVDAEDAIRLLSKRYREVLVMRYRMGMQYKEIAQTMGVSPQRVRELVMEAKKSAARIFGGPVQVTSNMEKSHERSTEIG